MRLPLTFSVYISRNFIAGMVLVLSILLALVVVFDTLEILRRAYAKDVSFGMVIQMVMLRLPQMAQELMLYAVLLGAIMAFSKLTRTSELIVARASGISVWQFLAPAVGTAFMLGWVLVMLINPISASLLSRFETMEAKYFKGNTSMLTVSSSGLWLRQPSAAGKTLIHALRVSQNDMQLYDVMIVALGENNTFIRRYDADSAKLENGYWQLTGVTSSAPGEPVEQYAEYKLETSLSSHQIQESFASPETLSFWELPGFIHDLKEAGFSALRHTLYWHTLVALPFLLSAMVFIAAAFSLRPPRRGKTGLLMALGILSGFLVYFMADLVSAIGLSGRIPVFVAAWAPVLISMCLGVAVMLHMEDG